MFFNRTDYATDTSIATSTAALHTDLFNTQENLYSTNVGPQRSQNPNAKIIMYSNAFWVRPNDATGINTPVTYAVANPNESWFLHSTASGNPRIVSGTSPNLQYYMNVGNAAYQSACVSHIVSMFQANNVNTTILVASNGVNVSTFSGSGTLNIASTTNFLPTGTVTVATSTGTARLSYTGVGSSTTLTGVSLITGTGTMSTGGAAYMNSFDGIFFDGISSNLVPGFGDIPSGQTVLEYSGGTSGTTYPTPWHTAMLSWLAAVIPALHSNGVPICIGNTDVSFYWPSVAGDYTSPSSWWMAVNGYMDGAMEESFADGGAGPDQNATTNGGHVWINNLANAVWSGQNGKIFMGHTHRTRILNNLAAQQTDEVAGAYGAAVALLAVNADPASASNTVTISLNGPTTTDSNVPWYPEYGQALALGAPSASTFTKNSDGTYSRAFTNGTVLVNPTASTLRSLSPYTASITITGSSPANTVSPSITGNAVQGQTLTGASGTWVGSPTPTLTYQWMQFNAAGTSGTNISGATSTTYVVQAGDVGNRIGLVVTGTNTNGSAFALSSLTVVVTASSVTPANTVVPVVSGVGAPGRVLSCSTGTWNGSPAPTFGYQWQSSPDGTTWTSIAGQVSSSYTVLPTDARSQLRCQVTATNSVGSATASSNAIAVVSSQLSLIPSGGSGLVAPTGSYTLAASDSGAVVTTTSTITLPATPVPGRRYAIKNYAAGITVTVSTGTSGKIDAGGVVNATSMTITTQGASIEYVIHPNGTDWVIV